MATGYEVAGRGDLDALFAPRVSAAAAATGYKSNGGVDLNQRFEPRGATTAIADTGYRVSTTDLAQIFKGIAAGTITLATESYSATAVAPGTAGVGYTLESDGDIIRTVNGVNTDRGDWINPKASAPGAHEVRATLTSGLAPATGTLNVWEALSTTRSWGQQRAINGTITTTLLIEIRLGGTTLGSCSITLTATREP